MLAQAFLFCYSFAQMVATPPTTHFFVENDVKQLFPITKSIDLSNTFSSPKYLLSVSNATATKDKMTFFSN